LITLTKFTYICTMHFETKAIHSTLVKDQQSGAVVPPLVLSTTFERDPMGDYPHGYVYSRAQNPNRELLEQSMAALEGGQRAFAFASGMAAINAILQTLKPGDHVLLPEDAYYTTILLTEEVFGTWGLDYTMVDMSDSEKVAEAVKPNTRLIWVETPSNPQLRIADIAAISTIAHNNKALCVVDNTWASPVLQQPLALGADISMHSSSKYIGGHSDVLSGVLVCKNNNYVAEHIGKIQKLAGAVAAPFDCWLLARGIRTLSLRVKAQTETAQKVAAFLDTHPAVEKVYYPGLETHANHAIAKIQMSGFGAMLSFCVKGSAANAMKFTSFLNYFTIATSLGGVESLIEHRRSVEGTKSISPENLLRISIGLEHADDLIADLAQAFDKL
jgi:cystathionine gamma-synthase